MINIRLYHVKAFKKEGGYFIFSCHNNDDLEGISLKELLCLEWFVFEQCKGMLLILNKGLNDTVENVER